MNTFKCNKKLKIDIATELFYCLFRVTENILKFLSCFQRLLPPRKRLHDLPVLCHSLEYEVTLFSLEKLCHRRFTKLYLLLLLCTILIQGPGQIAYFVVQFYSWFLLNLNFFSFVLGMVIYDYEFETKEIKIQTKEKLSHNTTKQLVAYNVRVDRLLIDPHECRPMQIPFVNLFRGQ